MTYITEKSISFYPVVFYTPPLAKIYFKMIFAIYNFNDDIKSMYEDYSLEPISKVHENLTKNQSVLNLFNRKYKLKREV